MKEDFLHYLWKYKKVPLSCQLSTGESLEILLFGQYNILSGADFFNAKLLIGGQQWAGNVEMHLKSSHWYAHGHQQDPAYRNVILHVVWEHDVEVFDTNNQPIPTLELKNIIAPELFSRYQTSFWAPYQFIPCEKNYKLTSEMMLSSWKERLFVERLEEKSAFIAEVWQEAQWDWEKVLFLLLLKYFGGVVNGEAFLEIGRHLDFSIIRKECSHPLHLEALFLGRANLLPEEGEHTYIKDLQQHYAYLQQKYNLQDINPIINFRGLRPQGFPTIRLSQLAQVYEQRESLFSKILEITDWHSLLALFKVGVSDFWETHYTFHKVSPKVKKPISATLLQLLLINVVVPIQYFYYKTLGKDITETLIKTIKGLPAESNGVVDAFQHLGAKVETAFDSQVLLQQHKQYCKGKRCLDCAIGIALLQKKL
jgi:hypothetical protein